MIHSATSIAGWRNGGDVAESVRIFVQNRNIRIRTHKIRCIGCWNLERQI